MEEKDKMDYVSTIERMTNRMKYYGKADIIRISFYKLALKYNNKIRNTDFDADGISMKRKLDLILKRIEVDCHDIIRK